MRVTPQCDTINSLTIHADPFIQSDPAVAFCGESYVVVWSDGRFAQNYFWLAAASVDTAGVIIDTSLCIGAQAMVSEHCPDIDFDGDRCLVVWYNYDEPFGVYGRFIDELGVPEDTVVTVATTSAGYNVDPSISFMADRNLVVWADKRPGYSDLDICGQFLSTTGGSIGEKLTIATGPANQMYPKVCNNGTQFLVIWREAAIGIFGQWLDTTGGSVGGIFRISDSTSFYRFRAGIDASAANFLVAWSEVHDDETDIFGSVGVTTSVEERSLGCMRAPYGSTVIRGALPFSRDKNVRIYDVCGREVTSLPVSCGIYYIQVEERIIQKIVKVE
ncbi:MAG: hypothetical protein WBE28_02530 [bacterium]